MKNYYFHPSGFGFWYQFGVLNKIHCNDMILYGSSSGSLICLIYLLRQNDRDFNKIANECLRIKLDIEKNNLLINNLNIHLYLEKIVDYIIKIVKTYPEKEIEEKLRRIFIIITEIKINYLPFLKKNIINPKNLDELKELVKGSCYIPFLSFNKNLLYYEYNKKYYIDGIFSFYTTKSNQIEIKSYEYLNILPCDYEKANEMYLNGMRFEHKKEKKLGINYFYFLIVNIFKNIINIIFFMLKNIYLLITNNELLSVKNS